MPVDTKQTKAICKRYSTHPNSRQRPLRLAAQVGVAGAAKQLGLHVSQLYA